MKQIKINIPEGFEIDKFDTQTGEVTFKPTIKNIIDEIQTLEDVFRLNNTTKEEFDKKYYGIEDEVKYVALEYLIVKAYNQGWSPNWSDSSECKWQFWWDFSNNFTLNDCDYCNSASDCSALCLFKNKEIALDAVKKFKEIYKISRGYAE